MQNVIMTYKDVRLCASNYFVQNFKHQKTQVTLLPKSSVAWKYRRGLITIFDAYIQSPHDFNCLEYNHNELKLLAELFCKFDCLIKCSEGLFGVFPKKLTFNYLVKIRKHLDDFYNQLEDNYAKRHLK